VLERLQLGYIKLILPVVPIYLSAPETGQWAVNLSGYPTTQESVRDKPLVGCAEGEQPLS
jgi:hypothetical protein